LFLCHNRNHKELLLLPITKTDFLYLEINIGKEAMTLLIFVPSLKQKFVREPIC
jgi:hypothetical protein